MVSPFWTWYPHLKQDTRFFIRKQFIRKSRLRFGQDILRFSKIIRVEMLLTVLNEILHHRMHIEGISGGVEGREFENQKLEA